jgi:hypothetical protein
MALILLMSILSGGCGYRVRGFPKDSVIIGKGSITIGKFKNETPYSKAGITLGEKMKDTLVANGYAGNFDVGGDYLINGNVQNLKEQPVGFSEDRLGLEYEISCLVSLELIETRTGQTIFNLKNYQDTSTYYRGVDPSYSRTNREKAIEFVLEKISIRFVDIIKEM